MRVGFLHPDLGIGLSARQASRAYFVQAARSGSWSMQPSG